MEASVALLDLLPDEKFNQKKALAKTSKAFSVIGQLVISIAGLVLS